MGDGDSLAPSKKRVAGREISRDDPGLDADDDAPEEEMGTFKRASDEVLATRRIVKVRRNQPASAASSNPFAGVCLIPEPTDSPAEGDTGSAASTTANPPHEEVIPTSSAGGISKSEDTNEDKLQPQPSADLISSGEDAKKVGEGTLGDSATEGSGASDAVEESKTETDELAREAGDETKCDSAEYVPEPGQTNKVEAATITEQAVSKEGEANDGGTTTGASAPLSSFQQLSGSQNAFTGLAGTGFANASFSFGTLPKTDGSFSFTTSGFGSGSGSIFGLKGSSTSLLSLAPENSTNGSSPLQGCGTSAAALNKSSGNALPAMQEVPVETGEENEKAVFVADASLFEFLGGGWKERGKGELKLDVATDGLGKARLVMRAKGNYRLILNASLYPEMKLTNMEKKGITFSCINSAIEGENALATFALKFKESSTVDAFRAAVLDHKGKKTGLQTPENSPKASEG